MVLGQATVPHPVEAEDALQDAERMLDPGPHARFGPVLLPLELVDVLLESGSAAGHVLRSGRSLLDGFGLPLVAAIALTQNPKTNPL